MDFGIQQARAARVLLIAFSMVGKSMDSITPNNDEVRNLLAVASRMAESGQDIEEIFKHLGAEVVRDEKTLAVIMENLDEYKRRIYAALESEQIDFDPNDFYRD